jgi:hypothetical protein
VCPALQMVCALNAEGSPRALTDVIMAVRGKMNGPFELEGRYANGCLENAGEGSNQPNTLLEIAQGLRSVGKARSRARQRGYASIFRGALRGSRSIT